MTTAQNPSALPVTVVNSFLGAARPLMRSVIKQKLRAWAIVKKGGASSLSQQYSIHAS